MSRNASRWWPSALIVVLLIGSANLVGRGQFRSVPLGSGGGGGVVQEEGVAMAPRVYFREPITQEAADTHQLLNKVVAVPYQNETPLSEVLEYVESISAEETEPTKGLQIYVDPVGLLRADRTPQSPVSINLKAVPIRRALELLLRQLDLTYEVAPDGLLVITSENTESHVVADPLPFILDELRSLRSEVAELRRVNGTQAED